MKKIIALLTACAALLCTFTACESGSDDDSSNKKDKSSVQSITSEKSSTSLNSSDDAEVESLVKDDSISQLASLAPSVKKAFEAALTDAVERDYDYNGVSIICSDGYSENIDAEDCEFLIKDAKNYFDKLDSYEYIVVINGGGCEYIAISTSWDSEAAEFPADSGAYSGKNLSEIAENVKNKYNNGSIKYASVAESVKQLASIAFVEADVKKYEQNKDYDLSGTKVISSDGYNFNMDPELYEYVATRLRDSSIELDKYQYVAVIEDSQCVYVAVSDSWDNSALEKVPYSDSKYSGDTLSEILESIKKSVK